MTAPVSVIVVSWDRRELLLACLDSLMAQTLAPAEIIVVDNGSTDGSAAAVTERFGERVRVVRSEINLGFAGGNNLGAAAATGSWLALLNNDAIADPRWIEEMMSVVGPGVGLVAGRLLRAERPELLDNAGVRFWPDGMSRGAFHYFPDAGVKNPEVVLPSGAAMLVRRAAFNAAGGFDESFFAYSEDTDLSLKVRLLGFSCAWADGARAFHRGGGGTLGVVSPRKVYLVEKNRLRVLLRYFPAGAIAISPLWTAVRYAGLLRTMLRDHNHVKAGGSTLASFRALYEAYRDFWRGRAADLAIRRQYRGGPELIGKALRLRLDFSSLSRLEADE